MTRKGFTIVELIVVITILTILGTIAFISIQGYSKSSRESVIISNLSKISFKKKELKEITYSYSGGLDCGLLKLSQKEQDSFPYNNMEVFSCQKGEDYINLIIFPEDIKLDSSEIKESGVRGIYKDTDLWNYKKYFIRGNNNIKLEAKELINIESEKTKDYHEYIKALLSNTVIDENCYIAGYDQNNVILNAKCGRKITEDDSIYIGSNNSNILFTINQGVKEHSEMINSKEEKEKKTEEKEEHKFTIIVSIIFLFLAILIPFIFKKTRDKLLKPLIETYTQITKK